MTMSKMPAKATAINNTAPKTERTCCQPFQDAHSVLALVKVSRTRIVNGTVCWLGPVR